MMISVVRARGGSPLMGMVVMVCRYLLLFWMMLVFISVQITLASPAETNLSCPWASILSADWRRNL